jgi:DNA-binding MarR family transcriptional regulator
LTKFIFHNGVSHARVLPQRAGGSGAPNEDPFPDHSRSTNFRYDLTMPPSKIIARPVLDEDSKHTESVATTRVLRQFRVVFNAVKAHFRQVEHDAGIGGAQLWALSVISASPGIGVTDLARAMDVHQSTASNLVKGLLERQLIVTERSGSDRRAVSLHASAAGAQVLLSAPTPFAGVLPDALGALDPATLSRLEQDLAQLVAVLAGDEKHGQIPLADL